MATRGSKSESVPVRAHVKTPNLTAEKAFFVSIANLHIHDNCTGGTLVFLCVFLCVSSLRLVCITQQRPAAELIPNC